MTDTEGGNVYETLIDDKTVGWVSGELGNITFIFALYKMGHNGVFPDYCSSTKWTVKMACRADCICR